MKDVRFEKNLILEERGFKRNFRKCEKNKDKLKKKEQWARKEKQNRRGEDGKKCQRGKEKKKATWKKIK